MKNLIISTALLILTLSCNGPKSGPLQKESFEEPDFNQNMTEQNYKANVSSEKIDVNIEPCEGCITVSNLLANKKSFSGKLIKIRGKVTKFNPAIMEKNWVHIQDGSEYRKAFDLTVTTDIFVSVGDTITFEGKIALDKDFGYGYVYDVLMEDGKPVF
jgi:CRISPR/Cas system CMR subunit Cmr6 (Cas7 group RAMP superfamily)